MNPKETKEKKRMQVYVVKYLWGVAHVLRTKIDGRLDG